MCVCEHDCESECVFLPLQNTLDLLILLLKEIDITKCNTFILHAIFDLQFNSHTIFISFHFILMNQFRPHMNNVRYHMMYVALLQCE